MMRNLSTVLAISLVSTAFFLTRSAVSPLLLEIELSFGVRHAEATRAFAFFTLGYGAAVVLSGFVSERVSLRRMIPLACLVGALGAAIVASSRSPAQLKIGLAVFGCGFGLEAPTAIHFITGVVGREDWQKALSIHEISPHVGMILAPIGVVALRGVLAWHGVFFLLSSVLVLEAVSFGLYISAGDEHGSAPSPAVLATLFRQPSFWLLILFFSLALAATDGLYLLIPTFLITEAGLPPGTANTVFGVSRVMPIIALFTAAVALNRFRPSAVIATIFASAGLFLLSLGFVRGWARLAVVFLQPSITALFFPAGFAALAALAPGTSRNVAISMVLPPAVILGVGVVPAFIGYMGDTVGFARGFSLLGVAMIFLGPLALRAGFDIP